MENKTINKGMWTFPMAVRFVNEHRLPMPVINEELFFYHIQNYDKVFGTIDKWNDLCGLVNKYYHGNPQEFVEGFKEIRENVIKTIKDGEAYQKFNNMDMNVYAVDKNKYKQKSKNIYHEGNIGKTLISIDLRKANFQAMNYVDKNIMLNSDTYDDFIRKFTDNQLVIDSKYFRQVFFGQLNPGRVSTVETYMVYQVLDFMSSYFNFPYTINSINADEVTIELYGRYYYLLRDFRAVANFATECKNATGIDVHCEIYTLDGYNFYSNARNRKHFTFYARNEHKEPFDETVINTNLMCVQGPYFALAYKLYNNMEPEPLDYHFSNGDIDCIFNDTFRIEQIPETKPTV